MKRVSISKLKNDLSAIIAKLGSMGSITVYDRKQPVAVIYPAQARTDDDQGRLSRLERSGIVERAKAGIDIKLVLSEPPALSRKVDAVKMLLQERDEGR